MHLDQLQVDQAGNSFKEMLDTAPQGGQDLIALAQYGLARVAGVKGNNEEAKYLGEISAATLEVMGRRDVVEIKSWLHTLNENNKKSEEQ